MTPPGNAVYYVAAYAAAALVYVLYGLSIVLRTRALRARLNHAPLRDGE
ncbi:MAG: hypothetical protein JWN79_116 [Gemmatimonadetes bacterium]|jgi:hypothetical protein|nr:hypothetical protein [Gemmatimonadota bacterium]